MDSKINAKLTFENALQVVLSQTFDPIAEPVAFTESLGRILAEDIISDINMPPFNKSAMDGYACRKSDLESPLYIVEEIPAGSSPQKFITTNTCARIMTGARVPEGADFVIMKEHVEFTPEGKVRRVRESANTNICYLGEDVKKGDTVLTKGTRILPQHIATMASVGATEVNVFEMPKVAVISTGNELVEPQYKPGDSQIRNSNAYQMLSQVQQLGIPAKNYGIVRDNEEELESVLSKLVDENNLVLISGGVSVGDYDFVPKVLNKLGVETIFHGLQAKPGKHLLLGCKNQCFVMGMPGNPVSSFIQFEILVKPLIYKLMGNNFQPIRLQLPLLKSFTRKKSEVLEFIPVKITPDGYAEKLEYHGSAHITAYVGATGIMEIPLGINSLEKGELVHVRPL